MCSHLISPCCSPCWWVFLRFSISSPGDFISFPHLFGHFIKRIWSVLISLSQKMFPTYFFILLFGSSAVPSFPNLFLQLIITVCLQFSKVFPTIPNLLVHVIIGFHQFFPPISWVHHDVSWVLVVCSFIVSLDFINLPHQSLHCTIHFHQFTPTYLLNFITSH